MATLADIWCRAGSQVRDWDGQTASGRSCSAGTYLMRLVVVDVVVNRSVPLVK